MSAPSKYEERKLVFNISALVRRALENNAIPMQINASPELVRRYEKVIYDRLLPPRGEDDKRPWLRLDGAPAVPFMADRSLKAMTCVLITDKDLPGIAVDLSSLVPTAPKKEKRLAVVEERVVKEPSAQRKEGGMWSQVKDRMKGLFK